jgi:hypothetical protein
MVPKTKIRKGILVGLFAVFAFFAHQASAASLYFNPASGSYSVGHTFTVNIDVSSADQAMNAAQGTVSFPPSKLEVLSISKAISVMNLWVQDPSFSNQDGVINFGGVVVNPGFQGAAGNIIKVTFQIKNPGAASLSFSSGSVLANDGKGTNILTAMQGADLTLTAAPVSSPATVAAPQAPGGLAIFSNPDVSQGGWYNFNSITFNWTLPASADAVNYAISNDPSYVLAQNPNGLSSNVTYDTTSLADGTWYFYLSSENNGNWSPVSVRSFRLDRTPPQPFVIVEKDTGNPADQNPDFQWAAPDKTSGTSYYQVKIGDGDWFDAATIAQGSVYVLPTQSPTDSRMLTVRAYDYAGNFTDSSINFQVAATCLKGDLHCALGSLFSKWLWLIVLLIVLIMIFAYWLLYRVFAWKRVMRGELIDFRKELQHDLKRIEERVDVTVGKGKEVDLSPAHLAEKKASLERSVEHIEEEVKEQIKKIEKM